VQLYCYFMSQSSVFCRHNPLCCFSTSVYYCKPIFHYRLSPETFSYALVFGDWRYSSTHSSSRHYMEVSGQLLSLACLPPGGKVPGTRWIGGWVCSRAGLCAVVKNENQHCTRLSSPFLSLYTDCGTAV
jgi:hypothetical protein